MQMYLSSQTQASIYSCLNLFSNAVFCKKCQLNLVFISYFSLLATLVHQLLYFVSYFSSLAPFVYENIYFRGMSVSHAVVLVNQVNRIFICPFGVSRAPCLKVIFFAPDTNFTLQVIRTCFTTNRYYYKPMSTAVQSFQWMSASQLLS